MKNELVFYKRLSTVLIAFIAFATLTSAYVITNYDIVRAKRVEIIDELGNVALSIDAGGIYYLNRGAGGNRSVFDDLRFITPRYTYKMMASAIQVYTFDGQFLNTVKLTDRNNSIFVNNTVEYRYHPETGVVKFNGVLTISQATSLEEAKNIAAYHYVNTIYK